MRFAFYILSLYVVYVGPFRHHRGVLQNQLPSFETKLSRKSVIIITKTVTDQRIYFANTYFIEQADIKQFIPNNRRKKSYNVIIYAVMYFFGIGHFSYCCQITFNECKNAFNRGWFTCEIFHSGESIVNIQHSTYLPVRAPHFICRNVQNFDTPLIARFRLM